MEAGEWRTIALDKRQRTLGPPSQDHDTTLPAAFEIVHLMAGCVALVFNWWNLFVRLADPNHHREAITSRPLLLQAIGRQTDHAGRTTVTIISPHGDHHRARRALTRIAAFFAELRKTAEQLTAIDAGTASSGRL